MPVPVCGVELDALGGDAAFGIGEHDVAARDDAIRVRVQIDVVGEELDARPFDRRLADQVQVIADRSNFQLEDVRDAERQASLRRRRRRSCGRRRLRRRRGAGVCASAATDQKTRDARKQKTLSTLRYTLNA